MPSAPTLAAPVRRRPEDSAQNVADPDKAARVAAKAPYPTGQWDRDAWQAKAEARIARAYREEALEGVVHPGF